MTKTLAELGEKQIIQRLKKFVPPKQIDDDTAQIKSYGKDLLVNTDLLIEGVHFSDQTTSPIDVGWRAITTNFSDLVGSGLDQIIGVSIGLVAPPDTAWEWVEKVYEGVTYALNDFGGIVLGGDCCSGKEKMLAVTALGTLGPLRLHRAKASPGDCLVVSGPHGLSRLGLALLKAEPILKKINLPKELQEKAIKAHQRPIPRTDALLSLQKCKPSYLPWRAAGTDSSDGLFEAIRSICESSSCQALLAEDFLPRDDLWPQGSFWDKWCFNGGEDFELVLSLPPEWANNWIKSVPNAKKIGYIRSGKPKVFWPDGNEISKRYFEQYEHF